MPGRMTRRNFVRGVTVTGTAAAALVAAEGTRSMLDGAYGAPVAGQVVAAGADEGSWVKTTCAMCTCGCGIEVRVVNGRAVKIEGNPLHPVNQGVCCLKGHAALETLYSPERLRHPRVQGEGRNGDWKEISWDEALALVAARLGDLRAAGRTHEVAFLHGELRGQMRSLLGRFAAAYGTPNVIAGDSPDEQAARLAMYLTQGINGLPVYDLNNAQYVLSFGGNLLEGSRHMMGYLGAVAFMRRGRPARGKFVAIHPRLGITGVKADEWVPIRPGTYGALALGIANVIINSDLYDKAFVRDYTYGFEDFRDESGTAHMGFRRLVLERYTLERTAAITGVAAADIARIAGEFATNRPAVAMLPLEAQGLGCGEDVPAAMAIHALNALVGSIDRPGGVLVQRFPAVKPWPQVQPDALAGAGLAHERVDGAGSDSMPLATSAAALLPDRILAGSPYGVSALFLLNSNPVYEMPAGGKTAEALRKVPFVVSFAPTLDESAAHADLILPAASFLESWGDDYVEGTGYAGVSLRQPVVEPVQDARNPGDVLLTLAAKLGGAVAAALPWSDYKRAVEYRLSGIEMDRAKFEANGSWSEMVYFNAEPGSKAWRDVVGRDRLAAPQDGRFDLFSRELHALYPDADEACMPGFSVPQTAGDEANFPFLLVTQRLITQSTAWQGTVPSLQECYGLISPARWDSWVEINPRAAEALGIKNGDAVVVESPLGRCQARARLYEGIWPNAVFLPPGQGHVTLVKWGRDAATGQVGANVNRLLANAGVTRARVYKA